MQPEPSYRWQLIVSRLITGLGTPACNPIPPFIPVETGNRLAFRFFARSFSRTVDPVFAVTPRF
jgi:hypothetical protein